jgi:hypothetical protein
MSGVIDHFRAIGRTASDAGRGRQRVEKGS